MQLTMRPYRDENDFWRARAFLRGVFMRAGLREQVWQPYRWDYWRWHGLANIHPMPLEEIVFFWETPGGEIGAILHPEGYGDVHLEIDPAFHSPELLEEMTACAWDRLAVKDESGSRTLYIWAREDDNQLQAVLARHGFLKQEGCEYCRWQMLDREIPPPVLPEGYSIRPVGEGADLIERCYASGLGFHNNDIRFAHDNREVSWYRSIQHAPLYRRDLDLVMNAPDGSVASFCTIWFDDVTRCAAFEPVATVPDQQRKGLGKAVIRAGLRRLVKMGAVKAFVGSYSPEAGALYAAAGFTSYDLTYPWVKILPAPAG